jgi:hypothetical protein
MGEIFKPEDIIRRVRVESRDLSPQLKIPITHFDIQVVMEELRRLREEVERIKRALEKHGIKIE